MYEILHNGMYVLKYVHKYEEKKVRKDLVCCLALPAWLSLWPHLRWLRGAVQCSLCLRCSVPGIALPAMPALHRRPLGADAPTCLGGFVDQNPASTLWGRIHCY